MRSPPKGPLLGLDILGQYNNALLVFSTEGGPTLDPLVTSQSWAHLGSSSPRVFYLRFLFVVCRWPHGVAVGVFAAVTSTFTLILQGNTASSACAASSLHC